jgi:hypothetical protein
MTVTEGKDSLRSAHAQSPLGSLASRATPPVVPLLRGRRRPALMALGASLTALGILLGVWLVNTSGDRQSVLAVRQQVPYGSVISADDLTTVQVSTGSGVEAISADRIDEIVGQVATTTLTPGSLLVSSEAAAVAPPAPGLVLVALAVPASRLPAGPLEAGDHILVVDTPAPGADPPSLPPNTIPATVVRIGDTDANGVTVVDVTVTTNAGPALAARSATGRIALVLQPRTG